MNYNFIRKILVVSVFIGFSLGQSIELKGQKIEISRDEVVLEISGLVCSFCAMGLQKKLSQLEHLDKSKYNKGIFIDVKNQYAILAETETENVDIEKAIDLTKKAGYEVKTIYTFFDGDTITVINIGEVK
ncbi:MAG: hypothetical protein QGH24_03645 [Candidatus Marinimicrobia bacterium]|jgi:hypothetical protein|nr:hypothetical protein [Candidatus Neomarinimicrobiota bacterium]|tara:strand:+ start:165 stop:554 length:390 start_codon:yes stop_codon:yes gene_type:complete